MEEDEVAGTLTSSHHPFTAPLASDVGVLEKVLAEIEVEQQQGKGEGGGGDGGRISEEQMDALLGVRGQHYDLVANGWVNG